MLLRCDRHRGSDLREWKRLEKYDEALARSPVLERKERKAIRDIQMFASCGPCYAGVSWGKDSTVLAHLVFRSVGLPLVWVREHPNHNPHCIEVRDLFLGRFTVDYHEYDVHCSFDGTRWHATGTLEAGFAAAGEAHGNRHISGIRGDESAKRQRRMKQWGVSSPRTCAPLGGWTAADVFAYLHKWGLPVHPVYAMSNGGRWPRERIRVCSLGGQIAQYWGRREWEWLYYRPELEALGMTRDGRG